jgi:hypothetical protein
MGQFLQLSISKGKAATTNKDARSRFLPLNHLLAVVVKAQVGDEAFTHNVAQGIF